MTKQMHLVTHLIPGGYHLSGWRHPRAYERPVMNYSVLADIARTAEQAKLDAVFIADGNAVRQMDKPALMENSTPSDRPSVFEPITLLSALSQCTERVGLVATATTTYDEPYHVARRFASLDHLSAGRASWNIVTGANPGDSLNFGVDNHAVHEIRYARAMEFVEACTKLWDSWEPDAFLQDKESGRLLDHTKVHEADYVGEHLSVKGPLNVAHSPQGRPVLFHAGQSPSGRALAAKFADCAFVMTPTREIGVEVYADLKARRAALGLDPDTLKVLPAVGLYLGETTAEAEDLYAELNALIPPAVGVDFLSKLVSEDLSVYGVDDPFPALDDKALGMSSQRKLISETAVREGLTIRQTYERFGPSVGQGVFKGSYRDVADEMEAWFRGGAADGFVLGTAVNPLTLYQVRDGLVPELQRRGLFRTEYTGSTLREHLGLSVPANQYLAAQHAPA